MVNKSMYFISAFVILLAFLPTPSLAYTLELDIDRSGNVFYAIPSVLGEEDIAGVQKMETRVEKVESLETPEIKTPEKIEVRNEDNKATVLFTNQERVQQELRPEKMNLRFFSASNTTPTANVKENEEKGEEEQANVDKVLREREERKKEKVEIQSEVADDGTVELQLESRNVKAKVHDDKIELNVRTNNIESEDDQGNVITLNHLPDQAEQRFLDLGVASISGSLEVARSNDGFVYTSEGTRVKKLLGIIPRTITYELTLNDATSQVTQQELSRNIVQQLLNALSF